MRQPQSSSKNNPHNKINTLRESSLHAALKDWYARPGDGVEVQVDGLIIDILRGEQLIEIQLRSFSSIKTKLTKLLENHPVRLVHPIAEEKWITRLDVDGQTRLGKRKSPKRGRFEHLFVELVHIPHLAKHPNFSLEVLLTMQEEIRCNDGLGSWRRRGWSIIDHKLVEVRKRMFMASPEDFRRFIPTELPEPFTSQELSEALGITINLSQRMVYCLRKMEIVKVIGKRGRSNLNILSGD